MDSYEVPTTTASRTSSSSSSKANREQRRWAHVERTAEEDYRRTEDEYEFLVREMSGHAPR
jgi:hypothetical protein